MNATLPPEHIPFVVLLVIIAGFGVGFAIWCLWMLYTKRNSLYIVKRRPRFLFWCLLCVYLQMFVRVPWVIYIETRTDPQRETQYNKNVEKVFTWVSQILFIPALLLGIALFCSRFWFFHFDTKKQSFEKNKEWRMAIDPSLTNNWFVTHSHTWGNPRFLFRILVIVDIIISVFVTVLNVYAGPIFGNAVLSVCFFIALVAFILLVFKLKSVHNDVLGIKEELQFMIGFAGVWFVFGLIIGTMREYLTNRLVYESCLAYYMTFMCIGCMFILVVYPRHLYLKNIARQQARKEEKKSKRKKPKLTIDLNFANSLSRIKSSESKTNTNTNTPITASTTELTLNDTNSQTLRSQVHSASKTSRISDSNALTPLPITGSHIPTASMSSDAGSASPTPDKDNDSKNHRRTFSPVRSPFSRASASNADGNSARTSASAGSKVGPSPSSPRLLSRTQKWMDIVKYYDGYEAFMGHLGKEFSIENLLFIQEYCETKNVLKEEFFQILDEVESENKYCRFNVLFPTKTKEFPNSLIAKQLLDELNGIKKENEITHFLPQLNDGGGKQKPRIVASFEAKLFSEASVLVCDEIIHAFKALYRKYIDGLNATFMINISHRQRDMIAKLLDVSRHAMRKQRRPRLSMISIGSRRGRTKSHNSKNNSKNNNHLTTNFENDNNDYNDNNDDNKGNSSPVPELLYPPSDQETDMDANNNRKGSIPKFKELKLMTSVEEGKDDDEDGYGTAGEQSEIESMLDEKKGLQGALTPDETPGTPNEMEIKIDGEKAKEKEKENEKETEKDKNIETNKQNKKENSTNNNEKDKSTNNVTKKKKSQSAAARRRERLEALREARRKRRNKRLGKSNDSDSEDDFTVHSSTLNWTRIFDAMSLIGKENSRMSIDGESWIDRELRKYAKKNKAEGLTEYQLWKWLFLQLMTAMEPSAYEIAGLLANSFARFRQSDDAQQLLKKLKK